MVHCDDTSATAATASTVPSQWLWPHGTIPGITQTQVCEALKARHNLDQRLFQLDAMILLVWCAINEVSVIQVSLFVELISVWDITYLCRIAVGDIQSFCDIQAFIDTQSSLLMRHWWTSITSDDKPNWNKYSAIKQKTVLSEAKMQQKRTMLDDHRKSYRKKKPKLLKTIYV